MRAVIILVITYFILTACANQPMRLPDGFEPPCYREWEPEDKKPEDFCSADVLFEGSPPSCMELAWCHNHGIKVFEEEWRTCGEYVGDCGGPRDAALMRELEHACKVIKYRGYCEKALIFRKALREKRWWQKSNL